MGDMAKTLVILIPTLLFLSILIFAIILGIIRGFRKSLILAIDALVAFVICIIIFAVLTNSKTVDSGLVGFINNFMGKGGLQRQLGVSEESSKMTEILIEYIPKQMNYGDGIQLILKENGQYLLQLVLLVYKIILAFLCIFIYLALVFIFYIIYLIFYPERRRKEKIEEANNKLETDKEYKKHRFLGMIVGAIRGLVTGIVVLAFIGSFFYIAGGTGENKYKDDISFNDSKLTEGYKVYEAFGSYGTAGIFKILNTIKVKDNMPFYLYAADLVFSGKINDPERGINANFNFANEMGAYTEFARTTIDLLMKYGKDEIVSAINDNKDIMNTLMSVMSNEGFQQEFNKVIDSFDAKTYFVNFSLSLLDSIVNHIDELKVNTDSDAVGLISLVFKKGYLSKYIPEEKADLDNIDSNPNYQIRPFMKASSLLTKDDAKSLLKVALSSLKLDETNDDAMKIMNLLENVLPSLEKLSILSDKRKTEMNSILERLYIYLDNRYLKNAVPNNSNVENTSAKVLLRGLENETFDWVFEIKSLLQASKDTISIAKNVYNKNQDVFTNILEMFDRNNPNAQENMEKYENIQSLVSDSKILDRAFQTGSGANAIKNFLVTYIPDIYVPRISYANQYNTDGSLMLNGETYNFLEAFKILLKNDFLTESLKKYKVFTEGTEKERNDLIVDIFKALGTKYEGEPSPASTIFYSTLFRSVVSGLIVSYSVISGVEIIVPNTVLETIDSNKVNLIKKEELISVVDSLVVILPSISDTDNTNLIKTIINNKDGLLESDIINATVINYMANGDSNIKNLVTIPDNYKNDASRDELKEYLDTNIWKETKELNKLIEGLDYAFDLSNSDIDLNDEEQTANLLKNNIMKLNDEIPGKDYTKLDACYESEILKASLSNHMTSEDVKGVIIPTDAYDDNDTYIKDEISYKVILKSEISKIVVVAKKLDLDLEEANIEEIYLKEADIDSLVDSKIFRATFDNEISSNDTLVIPNDNIYTLNNDYISETELHNLLSVLVANRENIFGTSDENVKVNIVNINISENSFKIEELFDFTSSNILHATIINKIANNLDYGIDIPNKLEQEANKEYLINNFINTTWYLKEELDNMLNSLITIVGENKTIGEVNTDEIKDKVFDLSNSDIDLCYKSIIVNYTISNKLDENINTLASADVINYSKEALAITYTLDDTFNELTYKSSEVKLLINALKELGINNASMIDSANYINIIFNNDINFDKLYDSIIVWNIVSNKMNDVIIENDKIKDHIKAHENRYGLETSFYKKLEIKSLKDIVKESSGEDEIDINDFSPSDIIINDNTKESIGNSYILMATITFNVNEAEDISVPTDSIIVDDNLIVKDDIMDLLDVINVLNLDLSNPSMNSIILNIDNNQTLAKSKIFRATIYSKMNSKEDIVIPDIVLEKNEANNTYLTINEAKLFLDKITVNKESFYTVGIDGAINIEEFNYNPNIITIRLARDLVESLIFNATITYKLPDVSDDLIIPSVHLANATKDKLTNDFANNIWYLTDEINHILDSANVFILDDVKINSENGLNNTTVKNKLLELTEDEIDTIYTSIIMKATLSNNYFDTLNTLGNRANVISAIKELESGYESDDYKFLMKSELVNAISAVNELGFNSISDFEIHTDYSSLIVDENIDYSIVSNSLSVWDIIYIKAHEEISNNPDIVEHNKSKYLDERVSNTDYFYYKEELEGIRDFMIGCNVSNIHGFNMDLLRINDTTISTIDESMIIRATFSKNLVENESVVIPYNTFDFTPDIMILKAEYIKELLLAIEHGTAEEITFGSFDANTLKPTDVTNPESVVSSYILRATITKQVRNDSGNTYVLKDELYATLEKDWQNNDICILSATEITNLLAGIKVFNTESFSIVIDFEVLAGLSVEEVYTVLDSNILSYIVSDLLISGFMVSGNLINYETYITNTSVIQIEGHDNYNLVDSGNVLLPYKFIDPLLTNCYEVNNNCESLSQVKLLTADSTIAFVIEIRDKFM